MKSIAILLMVFLTACGGTDYAVEEDPYLIDLEICEDQGGTASLFHVSNVDTGESYIDVQCDFEECHPIICKMGDCPVAECAK